MKFCKHQWETKGLKSGSEGTFEKRVCKKCEKQELKKIYG